MDEVVLTRVKGNEESLTGIKMKKIRMISSRGKLRTLYYGTKAGGGTMEVREKLRIPRPR